MKLAIRLALYVTLLILAGITFSKFRAAYQNAPTRVVDASDIDRNPTPPADTNAAAATNLVVLTNAVPDAETNLVTAAATNFPVANAAKPPGAPPKKADKSSALLYLGCFVVSVLGLGFMGAWDVVQMLGGRAGRSVMAEDYTELKDTDYELAEAEWAKGNHLDAIQLMRDYLKQKPSEQHAAIRIAEIYEKDLGNFLAAALELEEVLNKKLPREKWGWTAIRLSNLYSGKLNQPSKAMAVLDRIVRDYSDTSAAKKARARLGLPEPSDEPIADEPEAEESPESAAPPTEPAPEPSPDQAALPKGFRKKK